MVGESRQLAQYYVGSSGAIVAMSGTSVGASPLSCMCGFPSGDVCVCSEGDRGVFVLSSRVPRIVKRWWMGGAPM